MSPKYSRYGGIASLGSRFVSYVVVKAPSKPYIVVHSHRYVTMINDAKIACTTV